MFTGKVKFMETLGGKRLSFLPAAGALKQVSCFTCSWIVRAVHSTTQTQTTVHREAQGSTQFYIAFSVAKSCRKLTKWIASFNLTVILLNQLKRHCVIEPILSNRAKLSVVAERQPGRRVCVCVCVCVCGARRSVWKTQADMPAPRVLARL